MSTLQKNDVQIAAIEAVLASPLESAQAALDTIAGVRAGIPEFPFHVVGVGERQIANLKTVPPQFMEQSNTAMKAESVLSRGGVDPDHLRALVRYADAYGPVADAMATTAKEIRGSVDAAYAEAGMEALNTYSLAMRLARRPGTIRLLPLVQAMRRTLGRVRKGKKATDEPQPPVTSPVTDPATPPSTIIN
jgi:hypothetical protein